MPVNIQHALEKSVEYEQRLAEQMKIIERQRVLIIKQREAIALLHALHRNSEVRLAHARRATEQGMPALLRRQAE